MSDLPHNPEAERALIGAVLAQGHLNGRAEQIAPSDFTTKLYGSLWEAICRLSIRDDPIDVISVTAAMKGSNYVDSEIAAELARALAEVPSSMHLEKYAELVQTTAAKRKLALALPSLAKIAHGDGRNDGAAVFADAMGIIEDASAGIAPSDREQWTAAELAALEIPDDPWLLDRLMIENGLNLIAGEFASGKTFLCLDLAIGSALSSGAWGRRVKGGAALYFGADNSRSNLIRRVRDLCQGRGLEPPHKSLIFDLSPLELGTPGGMATIRSLVTQHQVHLVIVDALIRYMGGLDENSSADVGEMMAGFREIARRTGCTFVLVHHLRKVGQQLTRSKIADRVRGSGDFLGAVDSAVVITTQGEGPNVVRNITHVKSRESEESDPLSFSMLPAEEGGLVLAFERGDATIAADTLAEQAANVMAAALQREPGEEFTKDDLRATLRDVGITTSERTEYSAFGLLKVMPTISVGKRGRRNVYSWIG